jgi:hypothetical protein
VELFSRFTASGNHPLAGQVRILESTQPVAFCIPDTGRPVVSIPIPAEQASNSLSMPPFADRIGLIQVSIAVALHSECCHGLFDYQTNYSYSFLKTWRAEISSHKVRENTLGDVQQRDATRHCFTRLCYGNVFIKGCDRKCKIGFEFPISEVLLNLKSLLILTERNL